MKKGLIILIVVVVFIGLLFGGTYNSLVAKEESINSKEAEINNQLERRADLIPNLISTVKGLTSQEQSLVDSVTEARTKMTTGTTQDKLDASDELTRSLNVIVENYPEVKSDSAFTSLMDELAGTENRIAVARKGYNDEVASFNTSVKTFPSSIIASMFGFSSKEYLEVAEEKLEVPDVDFDN